MSQRFISLMVCLAIVVSFTACESFPEEHKGAAIGAGVGAAGGAIAGGLIGDDAEGAIIGGLIGALVGGAIGHYAYDEKRNREETVETYAYDAAQGQMLTIEDVTTAPQTVSPGDTVDLKMTYAVLNPTPGTTSEITEIREITHNGRLVGNPRVTVERADGTYISTVPLTLPSDADKGLYLVRNTVQAGVERDTMETSFTVK